MEKLPIPKEHILRMTDTYIQGLFGDWRKCPCCGEWVQDLISKKAGSVEMICFRCYNKGR